MDNPFGPNIGQALQEALNTQEVVASQVITEEPLVAAPPEVKQPAVAMKPTQNVGVETLVFCAVGMMGVDQGSLGCRFPEQVAKGKKRGLSTLKGWLMVGPTNTQGEVKYRDFVDGLQGFRWCLNQGKLYTHNHVQIWQRGSITEDYVVAVACRSRSCNWRDTMTRFDVFSRREAKIGCPVCHSPFITDDRHTAVLPGGPKVAPLCQSADDDILQAMHVALHEQEVKDSCLLPRLFAVYRSDEAPFDWMPADAKAKALADRFQAVDEVIRPFKQARMAYDQAVEAGRKTHIIDCVIEAYHGVRFGWVPVKDLAPKVESGDLGYTRRFGYTPKIKFM